MPERGFDTSFWSDPFVQNLPRDGKLLFAYLKTNEHCNQAGLYRITSATIAFETKLAESDIPELFKLLEPRVTWYPEENLVWVKDFIKEQTKSPKFLAAAAKCLTSISNNGAIRELLEYNLRRYTISIPYQYYMDRVSILTRATASASSASANSSAGAERDEVIKGKRAELATGKDSPRSRTETEETLCEGDQEVISVWRSVKGFKMAPADASALVASLRTEFADLDILEESKAWAARKLDVPLDRGSRPSTQIWNWMRKGREFARERRVSESKGQRVKGGRPAADFSGRVW